MARALELLAYLIWLGVRYFTSKSPSDKAPDRSILIVEPFQLGDVISVAATVEALNQAFPDAKIFIWTQDKARCVYQNDPRVSETIASPFPWAAYGKKWGSRKEWAALLKVIIALRRHHFDLGIDTRGDVRSQILLLAAGCRRRLGFLDYSASNITLRGLLLTHSLNLRATTHRFVRNYRLIESYLGRDLPALQMPVLHPSEGVANDQNSFRIIIHPSGGWKYKRWTTIAWRKLIESLTAMDGTEIILVGTVSDFETVEPILTPAIPKTQFRETCFSELKALLSTANLFVGLDSGPMNLASAMNIPVLALFGPGDSTAWHPLSRGSRYIHHVENFPCNPCFQTTCPYAGNNCMDHIFASEVIDVAKDIIKTESQIRHPNL